MNLSRRIVLAATLGLLALGAASAQAPLRIFDAHLHYNQEPNPFYDLDKVLEIFRRNNVTGILATSRPNKGTHQLMDAKAPGTVGGAVHPSLPPAQRHPDLVRRSGDLGPDPVRIQARLLPRHRRVPHLRQGGGRRAGASGSSISRSSGICGCTRIATRRRCCCCSGTIRRRGSSGRIPASPPPPARVKELLDKYPGLMGELSYRGGITEGGDKLSDRVARPVRAAIPAASCSAPTPGSTSAGSPMTAS